MKNFLAGSGVFIGLTTIACYFPLHVLVIVCTLGMCVMGVYLAAFVWMIGDLLMMIGGRK